MRIRTINKQGPVVLAVSLLLFASCKKEDLSGNTEPCRILTEITGSEHLTDLSLLAKAPELQDSLVRYGSRLQVYRAIDDNLATIIHCHVFYKGLRVFTENFMVAKARNTGEIYTSGAVPDSIMVPLTPTVTHEAAIEKARRTVPFRGHCISYQLGIYDLNGGTSNAVKDYRLV